MQLLDKKQKKEDRKMQNKVIKCKISHSMAVIIRKDKKKIYVIHFLHTSLLSTVRSTLINALNTNQLTT